MILDGIGISKPARGVEFMSATKKLTIAAAVLGVLCAALLVYITHGRFAPPETAACPRTLNLSDYSWEASGVSRDGRVMLGRISAPTPFCPQEHWGEDEFAVLQAAIDSFVLYDGDVLPPWAAHVDQAWWGFPRMWHNNRTLVYPLDEIFTLTAHRTTQHGVRSDVERIEFTFSAAYGAFAISWHGNIPHSTICERRQLFRMNADTFWALHRIIELSLETTY